MAQYKTGSVTVTNGSATVTGLGTLWSAEVSAGDIFTIVGSNAWYEVASVASNTSLTLTANYGGTSASGASYAITRDFTTNNGWPYPQKGDIETASLIKRALTDIDSGSLSTVDINGGTIDGTTIGGTTAAAGSFTTLSASGAVTLSGSTANGVAYLNGSKVLTTGSALTFDGTNFAVGSASAIGGGVVSAQGDLASVNGYVFKNSAANYGNTNNFVRLINSSSATVGGLTHPAAASLGVWGNDDIRFLTTGAASEQMRLTSTGLGIGTSSPGSILDLVGAGNPTLTLRGSAGAYTSILKLQAAGGGGSEINATGASSDTLTFKITGSELMRLTSTGLGIGTSSPASKLQLNNTGSSTVDALTLQWEHLTASTDIEQRIKWSFGDDATASSFSDAGYVGMGKEGAWQIGASRSSYLSFGTTKANVVSERLRIDSSGNVGLGVTPSAWDGSFRALEVGTAGSGIWDYTGNGNIGFSANAYHNGTNWVYKSYGYAVYAENRASDGKFTWYTAPSGTAGNAISFTQAMTLDASGNLLVGCTTGLSDAGAAAFEIRPSSVKAVHLNSSVNGGNVGLYFKHQTTHGAPKTRVGSSIVAVPVGSYTDGSGSTYSDALTFYTANANVAAERARIDSSGNLLVGRTNIITFSANDADGVVLQPSRIDVSAASVARITQIRDASGVLDRFYNGASVVGDITCTTSATSYNTSSDYRLKEDWVAVANASTRVNALKPVNFAWKADGKRVDGFLAHELAEVVPEAVTGEKDAVDADGNPVYQGIDQSKLVPLLTAALQEALSKIDSLESRLTAAGL